MTEEAMQALSFSDLDKSTPFIADKALDGEVEKIKRKYLNPGDVIFQGFYANLQKVLGIENSGIIKTNKIVINKILNDVIPLVTDESHDIIKLLTTSNLIKGNNSIPKSFFKTIFYGKDESKHGIPKFVGIKTAMPYEINMDELCRTIGITEENIKHHFEDIKTYWNLIKKNQLNTIVDLAKKINADEDDLFKRAEDFTKILASRTLCKSNDVRALYCLHPSCKHVPLHNDPWISFCTHMEVMRVKEGYPYFSIEASLASFESSEEFQKCTAKYPIWICLYYKINAGFTSKTWKFERNGETF